MLGRLDRVLTGSNENGGDKSADVTAVITAGRRTTVLAEQQ